MEAKEQENRLIVITGPTAAGKTKAAVSLAGLLETEIVSADSMQVYRGMDIGTAKVTAEEARGIKHHMTDILDPRVSFDAASYKEMAEECIRDIQKRGMIPIMCGGTGFYIDAVIYDTDFSVQDTDGDYRRELFDLAKKDGAQTVHRLLRGIDPEAAGEISENNIKRAVRALEFFKQTGKRISEHNREESLKKGKSPYDLKLFVLYDRKEALFTRINERVDRMMESGLLEETKKLLEAGVSPDSTAMQAIGYRQLLPYLEGKISLGEAVERIKTDSRRYAKRQLTWFKREKNAVWIDVGKEDVLNEICRHLWRDGHR